MAASLARNKDSTVSVFSENRRPIGDSAVHLSVTPIYTARAESFEYNRGKVHIHINTEEKRNQFARFLTTFRAVEQQNCISRSKTRNKIAMLYCIE